MVGSLRGSTDSASDRALKVLSADRLAEIADAGQASFEHAEPFPHIVLDDLVDRNYLREVAAEFPSIDAATWRRHAKTTSQEKYSNAVVETMGVRTQNLIADFQSHEFCGFLASLTGIEGLCTDETLEGGGMHEIGPGGYLKIHADFRRHPTLPLQRRLNLLCYLNEPWEPTWGGAVELWDRDLTECVVSIPPRLGTAILFQTSATSYHGHPDPLTCPPGVARKSLALYYYTPIDLDRWNELDGDTLYRARPGEEVSPRATALDAPVGRMASRIKRRLFRSR